MKGFFRDGMKWKNRKNSTTSITERLKWDEVTIIKEIITY